MLCSILRFIQATGAAEDVPSRQEFAREVHAKLRLEGARGAVIITRRDVKAWAEEGLRWQ